MQEAQGTKKVALHKGPEGYYFPAEWEPHESIWMSWPIQPDQAGGHPNTEAMAKMILALIPHVKVSLCVNDEKQKGDVLRILCNYVDYETLNPRMLWRFIPHQDHWMRDFGPIFMKSKEAGNPLKVAVFDWNCWGYTFHINGYDELVKKGIKITKLSQIHIIIFIILLGLESEIVGDGKVGPLAAELLHLETYQTGFVSEGGDREYNGKGTLIVSN